VVKLKDRENKAFILHIEIQSSNDYAMPLRMMRYYTDIAFNYPKLPIEQYVIYIGKQPLKMKSEVAGKNWQYRYNLIDMHSVDCQTLIKQDNPDALILAILCDFKGHDEQAMVNHITLRLHELLKEQPKEFRKYLTMLTVLSENRDLEQHIKKATEMITNVSVEKMPFYKMGVEKGELSTLQNNIIKILTLRFQNVPDTIKNKIISIQQKELLQNIFDIAMIIPEINKLFEDQDK
ncbi:MAG: hypothetical protein GQ569_12250, partial [Methylococcaceae bacterium]|nr:hypothetical protein [Methylococcaceae bacterium]